MHKLFLCEDRVYAVQYTTEWQRHICRCFTLSLCRLRVSSVAHSLLPLFDLQMQDCSKQCASELHCFPLRYLLACGTLCSCFFPCSCYCKHGHVGPLSPPSLNSLQSLRVLSNALSSKRACETWRQCVREGHTVGLTMKRRWGTGQTAVAEGEQIERGW